MTETNKPEPDQDKPQPKQGPVPSLEHEQRYGSGPRLKDLDAEIERELQEAMGGLSNKDLYGEPAEQGRRQGPPPGEQGRKKGRVISIHGPDVFVDVPGGRSQGVLPLAQFPDGPPAHVRAELYHYRFTSPAERRATGQWWVRHLLGDYAAPVPPARRR